MSSPSASRRSTKQDGWYDMTEARISRLIDTVLDAIMLRYKAL